MAGGSDEDNPIPINVTPLIDIIFCLIIFFMCSFHFKEIQGRLDSWLPKDGCHPLPPKTPMLDEVRGLVANDGATRLGARVVASDEELAALLADARHDYARAGRAEPPAIIDAEPRVPWQRVVRVMDACRAAA